MSRPGLSYEDVEIAINKLLNNKEKITISNIKLYTGKGSPTTISKYLKDWRINEENLKLKKNIHKEKKTNIITDKETILIKKILENSHDISDDILNNMSEEWQLILNEKNDEIKIKKLYSALIKEQIRRESAEKVTEEIKIYAESIKEQTKQRLSDIKILLNEQIIFLEEKLKTYKNESEINLNHYRQQIHKSNIEIIKTKKLNK